MMKFSVGQAKKSFFDREAVMKKVAAARKGALSRGGAYVRKNARDSLVYREKASAPGKPPSVHRTVWRAAKPGKAGKPPKQAQQVSPLREFIFFAWDDRTKTCVVGPARLNKPGSAPAALEYGGTARVARENGYVTIRIAARPYMAPALQKALGDLPQSFRDSVRG